MAQRCVEFVTNVNWWERHRRWAYELVPEANCQKFPTCEKSANQTYVEFAREKTGFLDKWCTVSKVTNFAQLRVLVLLEEFKACLPEKIVVFK